MLERVVCRVLSTLGCLCLTIPTLCRVQGWRLTIVYSEFRPLDLMFSWLIKCPLITTKKEYQDLQRTVHNLCVIWQGVRTCTCIPTLPPAHSNPIALTLTLNHTQVMNCYLECYHHTMDRQERGRLAEVITTLLWSRPRYDHNAKYFIGEECPLTCILSLRLPSSVSFRHYTVITKVWTVFEGDR